jgi:large subunit ribosomal protein L6
MSRLGKKPIIIPEKTEVSMTNGVLSVKSPNGELNKKFRNNILIKIDGDKITLEPKDNSVLTKSLWGTYASHITNMINGLNTPFEKKLIVEGVGFKSDVKGDMLIMALGFSHSVEMKIPEGLKVEAQKNVITVIGVNKELVGAFTAKIRAKKKPEPYKGKGIRYEKEVVRRKQGKKAA